MRQQSKHRYSTPGDYVTFSIEPLPNLEERATPPHLSAGFGFLWFGLGLTGILASLQWFMSWDPWSLACWWLRAIVYLLLFITTLFIVVKQWGYYYGGSGKKDGLFAKTLGYVNPRERFLDGLLFLAGGLLAACISVPTFWPLALSTLTLLTVLRCHCTLRRHHYAQELKEKSHHVPAVYIESLKYDDTNVQERAYPYPQAHILAGWIATHFIILIFLLTASGIFLGSTIYRWQWLYPDPWRLVGLIVFLCALWFLYFYMLRKRDSAEVFGKCVSTKKMYKKPDCKPADSE